jgi:hypothetical protein
MKFQLPLWEPSCELDAQSAHMGWGAFLVLAVWSYLGPWWAWGLLIGWAGLKEYLFDLLIERDTVPSSSEDFFFYLVGGLLGTVVILAGKQKGGGG